ncbi:shikimate dehydrogenase [Aliidiomarina halalkaliphila]|uniref:Shikimate dehydrogenase (NADP(+)) n=1 Tax=Aliidiomarina halalkaliphila TaxID=2593535 RepID=A0A552X1F3_9GAMM|nr:shikimate dehydrogenase [Aliidiomarina halalkaliphila]TRW48776.1 shikimate dehydrogenase [Aliidiomarina halalkaliphila]
MVQYKLTVFGSPIAHSRSPEIHQCFARECGVAIEYTRSLASASAFPEIFRAFADDGGVGANVTLPLKEIALRLADSVSERARLAGAVNTLVKTEQGWHGDNTDGAGLVMDLQRLQVNLANARVLILGAGGATRGVIQPLLSAHVGELVIANRTLAKAEAIVAEWQQSGRNGKSASQPQTGRVNITALALDDLRLHQPWDLIINATSASLGGERPDVADQVLVAQPFCYDMVYSDAPTAFMTWAQQHHCAVADGFGMLVGQAAESFRLWTGHRPSIEHALKLLR